MTLKLVYFETGEGRIRDFKRRIQVDHLTLETLVLTQNLFVKWILSVFVVQAILMRAQFSYNVNTSLLIK